MAIQKKFAQNEFENIYYHNLYNGYNYSSRDYAFFKRASDIETHTKGEWQEMVDFFNNLCCNCESEVIGKPCKDHIIPKSSGGSNSIRNVQPLCRECNTSKGPYQIDYRDDFCLRHGLDLPVKWQLNG